MRMSLSAVVPVLAVLALGQAAGSAQTAPAAAKTPPGPQTSAPAAAPAPRRAPAPKPNPFGPQPGATGVRNPTDVKTILYYAQDALGLLRSPREVDWVISMEFWGTGTLNVGGQPCRVVELSGERQISSRSCRRRRGNRTGRRRSTPNAEQAGGSPGMHGLQPRVLCWKARAAPGAGRGR